MSKVEGGGGLRVTIFSRRLLGLKKKYILLWNQKLETSSRLEFYN